MKSIIGKIIIRLIINKNKFFSFKEYIILYKGIENNDKIYFDDTSHKQFEEKKNLSWKFFYSFILLFV